MDWTWAIGTYTGDQAKYIKSLADAGMNYFIRTESGSGPHYEVVAAFRKPLDGPWPEHLEKADEHTARKLDALYDQRHSVRDEQLEQRDDIGAITGLFDN